MKKTTVVISGGFDPIHVGHIRYIQQAKLLGDNLVVILNNDNWLMKKKGATFMPEQERKEILEAIEGVDLVILSMHEKDSKDMSVCKELLMLHPDIFANGGDRKKSNTPESELCEKYRIKQAFNVGGGKVQSSSWLTEKYKPNDSKLLSGYKIA